MQKLTAVHFGADMLDISGIVYYNQSLAYLMRVTDTRETGLWSEALGSIDAVKTVTDGRKR